MQLENTLGVSRLLRVRDMGIAPATPADAVGNQAINRFLEPFSFSAKQRSAIIKQLKKDRIGTDDDRRTYIITLEFEIGAYRQTDIESTEQIAANETAVSTDENSAPGLELERVVGAANTLIEWLSRASDSSRHSLQSYLTASDPFGRTHDARYLQQLQIEIERLANACQQTVSANNTPLPAAPCKTIISATTKRFIRRLGETYEECFGLHPKSANTKPFINVLQLLNEAAELAIPLDAGVLAEILANG